MKKDYLYTGLTFLFLGMAMLVVSLLNDEGILDRLSTFSGSFIGVGIITVGKYFYWNRESKAEIWAEKQRKEKILLHDERKIALREKSGYICYLINLGTICVVIVIYSLLDLGRLVIITLGAIWWAQVVLGYVVFRWLDKRY